MSELATSLTEDSDIQKDRAAKRISMKRLVMKGSVWTLAGFVASQFIRLGGNLVNARLLFPEAFGLMAVVTVFLQGVTMLSDLGVGASIIRSRRGEEPRFVNSAWTIQVVRGIVLWLLICIIALPASLFYDEPELLELLPIAGFASVLSGFNSTSFALQSRQLQLGRQTLISIATQLIGVVITIGFAWYFRTVWSLALGGLSSALARLVFGYVFLPGTRPRFTWDRTAVRELLHFGVWIFVASGVGFLSTQLDKLILGKLIDMRTLGIYSLAHMLASMPMQVMGNLSSAVLYPALSHATRDQPEQLGKKLRSAQDVMWSSMLVVIGTLAFLGPLFFQTLYDQRYWDAGWMLQLLLIVGWFNSINFSLSSALLSLGASKASSLLSVTVFVFTIPGMAIGYFEFGLPGLIVGQVAGPFTAHLVGQWLLWRKGICLVDQAIRYTAVGLVIGFVVWLVSGQEILAVDELVHGGTGSIVLAIATMCLTSVYAAKSAKRVLGSKASANKIQEDEMSLGHADR